MDKLAKLAVHCEECDQIERDQEAKLLHVKFLISTRIMEEDAVGLSRIREVCYKDQRKIKEFIDFQILLDRHSTEQEEKQIILLKNFSKSAEKELAIRL